MSEQTEVSFDTALMMALHADAQKELNELPTPAQLKERYPDTALRKSALTASAPRVKITSVRAAISTRFSTGRRLCNAACRRASHREVSG